MKLYALYSGYYSSHECGPEIDSIWTTEEGVRAHMKELSERYRIKLRPIGKVFEKYKSIESNELTDGDYHIYYQEIYTDTEYMHDDHDGDLKEGENEKK